MRQALFQVLGHGRLRPSLGGVRGWGGRDVPTGRKVTSDRILKDLEKAVQSGDWGRSAVKYLQLGET